MIGEATPERIATVRKATAVVERLLKDSGAFQYLAILHEDRVTGMRDGERSSVSRSRCGAGTVLMRARPRRRGFPLRFSKNCRADHRDRAAAL